MNVGRKVSLVGMLATAMVAAACSNGTSSNNSPSPSQTLEELVPVKSVTVNLTNSTDKPIRVSAGGENATPPATQVTAGKSIEIQAAPPVTQRPKPAASGTAQTTSTPTPTSTAVSYFSSVDVVANTSQIAVSITNAGGPILQAAPKISSDDGSIPVQMPVANQMYEVNGPWIRSTASWTTSGSGSSTSFTLNLVISKLA